LQLSRLDHIYGLGTLVIRLGEESWCFQQALKLFVAQNHSRGCTYLAAHDAMIYRLEDETSTPNDVRDSFNPIPYSFRLFFGIKTWYMNVRSYRQ